jgi:hypothetical protein
VYGRGIDILFRDENRFGLDELFDRATFKGIVHGLDGQATDGARVAGNGGA